MYAISKFKIRRYFVEVPVPHIADHLMSSGVEAWIHEERGRRAHAAMFDSRAKSLSRPLRGRWRTALYYEDRVMTILVGPLTNDPALEKVVTELAVGDGYIASTERFSNLSPYETAERLTGTVSTVLIVMREGVSGELAQDLWAAVLRKHNISGYGVRLPVSLE